MMQHISVKDFHIYTDGSLDILEFNVTGHVVMDAGWILKGAELSFECGIVNFPSSTRPEILAILTAILATPYNSKLTIYSDSQAAINSISSTLSHNNKKPHIFKHNNFILLRAIHELIKDKTLDFHLVKVKGHSNETWNDAADLIAKRARKTSRINIDKCIDLDSFLKHNDIYFYPIWNNFIIDRNIRSFNNLIYRYLLDSSWSCNGYWCHILDRNNLQNNQYEWKGLWNYIKSLSSVCCTSFTTNNLLQFSIRCMNNLLLTVDNLRKRNSLYDSMVCPLCRNNEEETLLHLMTCSALQRNWKSLEEDITIKLLKHIKKRSHHIPSYQVLNRTIFEYNDLALSLLQQRNRSELTRGLVSHTITSKLRKIAPESVSSLTQKLLKSFFIAFQKHIWIPRCEKMNLYEVSLGISSTQKRDYKTY
jgi:ribonuclease HI